MASCSGLTTKDHPPLVFALNLGQTTAHLSLVKGDEVLVDFAAVEPLESRPLTRVPVTEGAVLRLGVTDPPGTDWTDPSGTPYNLRLQNGHLYAIVVDFTGKAALYSLPEVYSSDPKLCVVNATPYTLSQIQVAPDWAKNVKVYAQDVAPVIPSEFYSFEPKTLGLYWQTLEQVADGGHSAALGSDGQVLRNSFDSDRYYLFLAGEGSLRDLTPQLD